MSTVCFAWSDGILNLLTPLLSAFILKIECVRLVVLTEGEFDWVEPLLLTRHRLIKLLVQPLHHCDIFLYLIRFLLLTGSGLGLELLQAFAVNTMPLVDFL